MVLVTARVLRRATRWSVAMLGLLHGAAMLLRPEHPLLLAMWAAWIVLARPPRQPDMAPAEEIASNTWAWRSRILASGAMVALALVVCLPWTTRAMLSVRRFNTVELDAVRFNLAPVLWSEDAKAALNALPAFARPGNFRFICDWAQRERLQQVTAVDVDRFFNGFLGHTPTRLSPIVLVSNQGPFSFALANHPKSDGGFSREALEHPLIGGDPKFEFAFPPHNRIFNDGWRVGWEHIVSDPGAWFGLVGQKLQRFANGLSMGFGAANLPLGRDGVRHRVDILTVPGTAKQIWQVGWITAVAVGIVLYVVRRMRAGLWLLIIVNKIIITVLFYGYARQAASIAPAFFVLIAIAVDSILLLIDRRWPGWLQCQRGVAIGICVIMLALDIVLARGEEKDRIVIGPVDQRPDLGPGAFASYGEIEIRRGVP
jgi:hypothetical protein